MGMLRLMLALAILAAPTAALAQRPLSTAEQDSLRQWIHALRSELGARRMDVERARTGEQVVSQGDRVEGDVIAYRGNVQVSGEVAGSVVAVDGDVVLREGGRVRGDAVAIGGTVRQEGGMVDGELRALTGHEPGVEALFASRADRERTPGELFRLVVAWFAILAAIAVGVLIVARANLTTIAERIRTEFGRSLLFGFVGQLALAPACVLLVVGLAITVIGLLLIPFALVAFVLAVAGLVTLGFLAMAYQNGRTIRRAASEEQDESVGQLTAHLMIGLAAFFALWAVAALAGPLGIVGSLLRAMVVVITWVAMSVGLGATILSRGGTRVRERPPTTEEATADDYSWQTPTPVSGVSAARRPTPAPRAAEWK